MLRKVRCGKWLWAKLQFVRLSTVWEGERMTPHKN